MRVLARVLAILPPVVLLSAGATMCALWSRFPARWVAHIGADGQPNGWMVKTPLSAGFPLLVGATVWLVGEAALRVRRTQGTDTQQVSPAALISTRLVMPLATGVIAYLSIALPLAQTGLSKTALLVTVSLTVGCSLAAVVFAAMRQRPARTTQDAQKLWWPRESGLGYTLNFSHPMAIPVLIALLAPVGFLVWNVFHQMH